LDALKENVNLPQRLGLDVALVHDWLTVPAGSEDVFKEICHLYPGDVFTSQWDRKRVTFVEHLPVHTSYVQDLPMALTKHYLYAPLLPGVYRSFPTDEFDIVLSDSHSFAHAVPKRPGALHINYYHTPARSLWMPEIDDRASSGKLAALKKVIARRLRRLDLEASRNPDVVFANSKTTAKRIERFYGRHVDAVIYPPVDTAKWSDVERKSGDMGYLVFGRLIGYKRVDLAIEACKQSGDWLQIVGSGPLEAELKAQAEGYGNIVFHGRLPDAELKELMSQCRALLFPGYEDFGIVPVEAMAAGLPVIAYAAGGASETVLPECGVLFHEQTVEALWEAMDALDSAGCDPRALSRHASQYDRSVFQERYRTLVDEAIDKHFSIVRSGYQAYAL
jgi:glycosyltransferase involved in cell wall biosynthesis